MSDSRGYWLHRIVNQHPEWSLPLLHDHGLLSIGFRKLSNREFVSTSKGNEGRFTQSVEEAYYPNMRQRFTLQRFMYDMKQGDYVVIPVWSEFHVYEFLDDEVLVASDISKEITVNGKSLDEGVDLGFFKRVREIAKWISRADYASNALFTRMKVRQTNVRLRGLGSDVLKALEYWKKEKPINLHALIVRKTAELVLTEIREMINHNQFEKLIAWYFRRMGAQVYIPAKKERNKDGDSDIVAIFDMLKITIYVQAKHHTGTTNANAVKQIKAYQQYKDTADDESEHRIGWVISTADSFTEEAEKLAEGSSQGDESGEPIGRVRLIAGKEFATMLLNAGISDLSDFAARNYKK